MDLFLSEINAIKHAIVQLLPCPCSFFFLFNFYIYLFMKWIQCLSLLHCLKMRVEQRVYDFRSRFYWGGFVFVIIFNLVFVFYVNPFARSPEYAKINFCSRLMMIVVVFQYLFLMT